MENNCYKKLFDILIPIFYLSIWFVFVIFCKQFNFFTEIEVKTFLILSFLVMFFGMITKSTSWAIGNNLFNIRGDSRRHIEYSWHENWENTDKQKTGYTIKIDYDDYEIIKKLMTHHNDLMKKKEGGY